MADDVLTQQLQAGELEQLDGQGRPVGPTLPEGEVEMYNESVLNPIIPEDDLDMVNEDDVLSDLPDDALAAMYDAPREEEVVPPSQGQYQGAANLFNTALQDESVTPEKLSLADMAGAAGTIGMADLNQLWEKVGILDQNTRKAAALAIIDDPTLTAEAKIQLVKESMNNQIPDVSVIERAALHTLAEEQAALEDDPSFKEAANEFVKIVNPVTEAVDQSNGPTLKQTYDIYDEVRQMYDTASKDTGVLDIVEQMTPVGSLPTMNRVVARIYQDLNITDPDVVGDEARPWVTLGNSLLELRSMYYYASPEMKKHMAEVIVKNLKKNTGLFQDTNDIVTMHILSNVLHPVLFDGKQYNDGKWIEKTPEQQAALDAELQSIYKKMQAAQGGRDPEGYARLQQRAMYLDAQRNNLPGPEQVFDNIFNIMDVGFMKQLANGTLRAGSKLLPASLRRRLKIAPTRTTEDLVNAVADPNAAEAMGTSQRGAIDAFMARTDDKVEDGANGFVVMNEQAADAAEFVARTAMPLNLTAAETAKALENFKSQFGYLISKPKPKVHLHASAITPLEDGRGMAVEAVFGRTATTPYRTLGAARKASKEASEEVFGVDANLQLVQKDPQTGQFVPVKADLPDSTKGEFFQMVKETRLYSEDRDIWGKLTLPEDAVTDLGLGVGVAQNAFGLNIFDKFHTNLISSHVRSWRALGATFRGQMRDIAALNINEGLLLSKIVRKYEGQNLSPVKVERLARGNQKVVKAYQGYRAVTETMYQTADRLSVAYLRRDGFNDIRVNGSRVGFGRPLAMDGAPRKVFNPNTGTIVQLDKAGMKGLYDAGGTVVEMKYAVKDASGTPIRHVMVDKKAGGRVLPVPAHGALPKIPGYYPHITQGNYWVRAINSAGDEEIIGVSATKSDALAFMEEVKAGKGPKGYTNPRMDVDPSLVDMEDWVQYMEELVNVRGGVIFGQRDGGKIRNLTPDLGDSEIDPIGALLRGAELLSTIASKGEITASMRNRLYTYLASKPGLLKTGPNGRLPSPREVTEWLLNRGTGDVDSYRKALAYLRQIELLEHSPDATRAASKEIYEGLAHLATRIAQKDGLVGKAGRKAEAAITDAQRKGLDPSGAAVGVAHRIYIAMNPVYQRVVQTIQSSVVGMTAPASYMKAWRLLGMVDTAVRGRMLSLHHGGSMVDKLITGAVTDKALLKYSKEIAPKLGWKPEEFRDVIEAILSRGLVDSVAHNDTLRQGLSEASGRLTRSGMTLAESTSEKVQRLGTRALAELDERIFGIGARAGFQGGEQHNQLLSFLTWYIRDREAGVANIKSAAYVDDLVGRVSVATGNMVREAAFPYTRWYTKVLTNWLQFPHKMAVMMLPEKLGGPRNLSGMDKAKMIFTQFMLFGAKSTPMAWAVWKGIEELVLDQEAVETTMSDEEKNQFVQWWRSEPVQGIIDGFAMDYMANKVMKALLGEPNEDWSDFELSAKLAPGSGHDFLIERVHAIASMDAENFFGTIGATASKFIQYGNTIRGVTMAQLNGDQEPLNKRMEQLYKEGLTTVLPMYGRYLTYRMVRDYGYAMSQGGAISDTISTDLEGRMHFMLGIETKDRASYYEAVSMLDQKYADPNEVEKEVKEAANTYWRNLVLTGVKLNEQVPDDEMWYAALNQHIANHQLVLSMYGAENGARINELITEKLDNAIRGAGDSAETLFVERLTKKMGDAQLGEAGPDLYLYLRNEEFVKNHPKRMQMVQDAYQRLLFLEGKDE